jgi:hypothetical protein
MFSQESVVVLNVMLCSAALALFMLGGSLSQYRSIPWQYFLPLFIVSILILIGFRNGQSIVYMNNTGMGPLLNRLALSSNK